MTVGLPLAHKAAICWAMLFAGIHAYWAVGGPLGLPPDLIMRDHPLLLAVDLVAIPLCMIAALIVLLTWREGAQAKRGVASYATAFIALCCFAHALPSLVIGVIQMVERGSAPTWGEQQAYGIYLYEPYWMLGGMLFAWTYHATARRRERAGG